MRSNYFRNTIKTLFSFYSRSLELAMCQELPEPLGGELQDRSIMLFVEGCILQKWSEQYFCSNILFQNLELPY